MRLANELARASDVEREHGRAAALDFIFELVDEQMLRGQQVVLNQALASIELQHFSSALVVGLLTATFEIRGSFPERVQTVSRARALLTDRHGPDYATWAVAGLE